MRNIVIAEGNSKISMQTLIFSSVVNIILNPIFVIVLHMGVKGSAIATVIAQSLGAIWLFIYFIRGKSTFSLQHFSFNIKQHLTSEILYFGFPTFVLMAAGSSVSVAVNWMLNIHGGSLAIAAYGITNRILGFAIMPINGFTQVMPPIVGYNYGAKNISRVRSTVKLSFIIATLMAIISWVIVELFASYFVRIFTSDTLLIQSSSNAIRIILLCAPTIGIQIVCSGLYQSLGKIKISLLISIMRQLVCLIPLLFILPSFWGVNGVWYAFPIADLVAFLTNIIIFSKTSKSFLENMN